MIRMFYAILVRLHPRAFREEFAEEMLWIFDQESGVRCRARLFVDVFVSLGRQRWFRNHESAPLSSADGGPAFYVSAASMPRPAALVNGLLSSIVAFAAVAFLIVHGGGTSGFVKLPTITIASSNAPMPRDWLEPQTPGALIQLIRSADYAVVIAPVQDKAPPLNPELAALLPTARSGYPSNSAARVETASLLFQGLDINRDGVIMRSEWVQRVQPGAQALLECADLDHDGGLSLDEMRKLVAEGVPDCASNGEE